MYEIFEQLLETRGLTAYRVAKEAGITQTVLSNWKTGRKKPGIKAMTKIAEVLGVSVKYLETGKEDEETVYIDPDARRLTAFLHDNPDYRILLDTLLLVKHEDVAFFAQIFKRLIREPTQSKELECKGGTMQDE